MLQSKQVRELRHGYAFLNHRANQEKVCLIAVVHETGAVIKCQNPDNLVSKAKDIIGSNEYFGEILRKKMTSDDLKKWLYKCVNEDIVEFASLLELPLSEATSMLWDINKADGEIITRKNRNGEIKSKWKSALLDFSAITAPLYGEAKDKDTVEDWLNYAGARMPSKDAYKRAQTAYQQGKKRTILSNGQAQPITSDWFGITELTKPKGWEILPGNASKDSSLFEKYLDAFMEHHDNREKNDRAAYNLLLTDYVGVNENGSLADGLKSKCLRAVLLGYLKTGEVVLGNCRSCSSCVPDGNFELDMKVREQLVERLGTDIKDLLDLLETYHASLPIGAEIQQLWGHVEEEEARGRSLLGTVVGWTLRLLNDRPEHKTAAWIRVDGMLRGILPIQPKEACKGALDVLNSSDERELAILWETICLFENVLPDVPEAILVRAKACQRLSRIEEAQSLWLDLLNRQISKSLRHMAHSALFDICKSGCRPVDSSSFTHHGYEAARSAPDFKSAERFYAEVLEDGQWEDLCKEIVWCIANNSDFRQPLLEWWLNRHLKRVMQQVSSLSTGGLSIITNLIGNIAGETSKHEGIEELLAEGIIQWSEKLLGDNPGAFQIRALKMILMARYDKGHQIMDADLLAYLDTADSLGLQDLLSFNESENVFTNSYVPELLQAELAYRDGEHQIAELHWGNSMDSLSQCLLDMVGDRILSIGQKNSIISGYTIPRRFHSLMLARLNNTNDWNIAVPIFKGIAPELDATEFLSVMEKNGGYGPVKMLDLIDIWTGFHMRARGTHQIIENACVSFNKIMSGVSVEYFFSILNKFHPYEIATFGKFNILRVSSFLDRYLERCSSEFLLIAYKNGIVDKSAIEKYELGNRLLNEDTSIQSDSTVADASPDFDISEMKLQYLLNEYRPESLQGLCKWLNWLDTRKQLPPELLPERLRLFDHFLSKASSRKEYDQLIGIYIEYARGHFTDLFRVIKNTVDIVTDIEGKTSIHLAESLDKDNITLLAKTMAGVEDTEKADVYIAILRSIRARTKPGWKTPLVRLVEFLVNSGRVYEAELIGNEPELAYGKKRLPFRDFVLQFNGELRPQPENDAIVNQVADAYVRTWLFCATPGISQRRPLQTEQVSKQRYEFEPLSSQNGPIIIRRKNPHSGPISSN